MTPQQIAEKVYPKPTDIRHKDTKAQERDELIQLVTTLQKETWDQACKAMEKQNEIKKDIRKLEKHLEFWRVNTYLSGEIQHRIDKLRTQLNELNTPPFNPEK